MSSHHLTLSGISKSISGVRHLAGLFVGMLAAPLFGATLQSSFGEQHEGDIRCTTESRVFIARPDNTVSIVDKAELVPAALAAVEAWEAANADWSKVPVKYDTMPTTVFRVAPDRSAVGDAKNQVVMIALLLNEDGSVHSAYVKDSTDANLNGPTIEAVSRWKFTPAVVGNAPTRTVVSVPVQF